MFQLVFRGECTPGTDPEAARNNARTLFKANADQVARMFSGKPVVIRNRLEEAQAEKYRGVLHKNGMVAYVEPMDASVAPKERSAMATPSAPEKPTASETPRAAPPRNSPGPVKVEPGDRPKLAGEKVDGILAGSELTLDPPGMTLAEHREAETPMFENLDGWTLAPAGSELAVSRELPPPVVPDVSHLSLADRDDEPGNKA
jgi:hypothetical protein